MDNHVLSVAFTALSGGTYIVVIWGKIKKALRPRLKGEITIKIG